ncbi:MAG: phenylacetate--CoA ligase family protein [Gaiellaceae bacterium]
MSAVRELLDLTAIMRAQYEARPALEARQLRGVRDMLAHARGTVPYYADHSYQGGLTDLSDVTRLPVLRKSDVLAAGAPTLRSSAVGERDVVMTRTSGTSGRRLDVAHDRRHMAYHNAACLRRFLATEAYRPWYRLVHLRPTPMPTRWYQRLGLFRREVALSSWSPPRVREAVLERRPQVLIGYPAMLRELVRTVEPDELDRLRSSLRLVFTESELLVDEHRAQLQEAFGAPIFDEYSAYEVLNIAFDCVEGSAHVAEDRLLVEIVDADGQPVPDGEEGVVVVTAFQERAMPLVRYWLGDRGRFVPGRCPCRRTFRRLELTRGRSDDHVVLPDGSLLYVDTFLYLAAELPGVAESAVRQDRDGLVTIHLVPDRRADGDFDAVAGSYVDRLQGLVRRRIPLRVERRERLTFTEGGKGAFLKSDYRR